MSGHSKWHNIQKTKGAADAKRSQIFTKIAREMIVAVKTGGSGDPNNNSRLATVIAKAKAANMPNDNIKRTIDKALGSGNTDSYENVVYEGYGPSGVAVIVDALTDNRNRTAPEVRHLLDKYGKGLGATGCVSWSFDKKGVIVLDAEDLDEDTVMMDALEAGASDFQADEDVFEIYTEPSDFSGVREDLEAKGYNDIEFSKYTLAALRALEGVIKFNLSKYNIPIPQNGFNMFAKSSGIYVLQQGFKTSVPSQDVIKIENCYNHYFNNRHTLCHFGYVFQGVDTNTRLLPLSEFTKQHGAAGSSENEGNC